MQSGIGLSQFEASFLTGIEELEGLNVSWLFHKLISQVLILDNFETILNKSQITTF